MGEGNDPVEPTMTIAPCLPPAAATVTRAVAGFADAGAVVMRGRSLKDSLGREGGGGMGCLRDAYTNLLGRLANQNVNPQARDRAQARLGINVGVGTGAC
jgi:hypothetical protein